MTRRLAFHRRAQLMDEDVDAFAKDILELANNAKVKSNALMRDRFLAGLLHQDIVEEIVEHCHTSGENMTFASCLSFVKERLSNPRVKQDNGHYDQEEDESNTNDQDFGGIEDENMDGVSMEITVNNAICKAEVFETFEDNAEEMNNDLDANVLDDISEANKISIIWEMMSRKELLFSSDILIKTQGWLEVFDNASKYGVQFESVLHLEKTFDKWKIEAMKDSNPSINSPNAMILELTNLDVQSRKRRRVKVEKAKGQNTMLDVQEASHDDFAEDEILWFEPDTIAESLKKEVIITIVENYDSLVSTEMPDIIAHVFEKVRDFVPQNFNVEIIANMIGIWQFCAFHRIQNGHILSVAEKYFVKIYDIHAVLARAEQFIDQDMKKMILQNYFNGVSEIDILDILAKSPITAITSSFQLKKLISNWQKEAFSKGATDPISQIILSQTVKPLIDFTSNYNKVYFDDDAKMSFFRKISSNYHIMMFNDNHYSNIASWSESLSLVNDKNLNKEDLKTWFKTHLMLIVCKARLGIYMDEEERADNYLYKFYMNMNFSPLHEEISFPEPAKIVILKESLAMSQAYKKGLSDAEKAERFQKLLNLMRQYSTQSLDQKTVARLFRSWHYYARKKYYFGISWTSTEELVGKIFGIGSEEDVPIECKRCKECFESREELKNHNLDTHPRKTFKYVNKSKHILNTPKKRQKSKVYNDKTQEMKCFQESLKQNFDPEDEFISWCNICQKEFDTYTETKKHNRVVHGRQEPVFKDGSCLYCRQIHRPRLILRSHIRTVHPGKAFPCDHCNEVMRQLTFNIDSF